MIRWQVPHHELCRLGVRVISRLFLGLRAYGQENVPDHGGVLLVSNHQSYVDPPLVGAGARRRLVYMARAPLFANPLFGALLRSLDVFPVNQDKPDKSSIRFAIEQLRAGQALLVFPEGTRTPDGELGTFKGGFRLLVRRADVPVIPVALDGAYRAWPRWRLLPRPGRVRIMYGAAIRAEEFEGLSDEEAGGRVAREISLLLDRLRRLP